MKFSKIMLLAATAIALPTAANAAVVVTQGPGTALGAFSFSVVGTTITINETWNNTNNVFLQFTGLDAGVNYTVVKRIINNSGQTWTRIANELLDPGIDPEDPSPQPGFVPLGWSTSSDQDGLSFAQGSGLPRTSSVFPIVEVDELSDARDFIDFSGASVASGAPLFTLTFGLRDNLSSPSPNQPFLLSQRVNAFSVTPRVPEPATWAMMLVGFGVVGGALRRRARMSISYA
jgi:PEP-CTERM motif